MDEAEEGKVKEGEEGEGEEVRIKIRKDAKESKKINRMITICISCISKNCPRLVNNDLLCCCCCCWFLLSPPITEAEAEAVAVVFF